MKTFFCFLFILSSQFIRGETGSIKQEDDSRTEPLFLTNYIESSNIEEGRKLAEVKPFLGDVKSYSGLLTVDKDLGSNIFFWYFPTESKASNVPLLVWLNGYSTASTYGVFLQNGPYDMLTPEIKSRNTSWNKYYDIVYFDSPVGVGYSFSNSTEGYSTKLEQVSLNLEKALEQFLKLFPDLADRELFLTSLSMGGKYVPALAHRLIGSGRTNLKGIFVGNPLLNFDIQMNFENYLYELGFIDKNQQPELIEKQNTIKTLLKEEKYDEFNKMSTEFWLTSDCYLVNITGLDNIFDYDDNVVEYKYYWDFMQKNSVKNALHVGGITCDDGTKAMKMFGHGIGFSSLTYLEDMVDSLKMMFYAGQTDVSCAYPMMVDALNSMNWKGKEAYRATHRQQLYKEDGRHTWGYIRSHENLSDVMIRKAGHSAVTSQPEHVLWLLKNFTQYSRFENR